MPAPRRNPPRAERHAVIIGIDKYQDPSFPSLHFARADAEAFHATLVEHGHFHPTNVTLLVDEQATQRAIWSALGARLPRQVRGDDAVVVYFAGYGAAAMDARGAAMDGLKKFLLPHDAESDDLYATAIPTGQIAETFDRVDARNLVFFLDACYSGSAGGRSFGRDDVGTRGTVLSDTFLDEIAGEGRTVITSCGVNELSVESQELGHGLFTYCLVKGMRGEADTNGDGAVDVDELFAYVASEVSVEARRRGAMMRPVRKGTMRGGFVLTLRD